ncbi:MAG: NAD-dependent epimerase/dehydratase family protein [Candidatus Palauibacterales bacterium]|nr:NAD-dependent epimerase/dehydratase family protein [Candidatus Palauibacterales bacterium]MDP2529924.1 NAD-dependent epimerase/dehydratase family protein [Candidatus Palauibacterales bacterium]MDP2583344.1 NAD-dependent epimerase/dehydratase family protein [Candidatus Palauibacterales bacterium]
MAEALIVGCGYTGLRLGRRLGSEGHRVMGTTRSPDRVPELRGAGIEARLLDLGQPGATRVLGRESPDVVFYLAPPIGEDPGAEIEALLRVLGRAPLEAFVYASSTSVYGDRGGEIVDASTLPRPDSPAGRARLATERRVLQAGWTFDARPRIARIGGIYGPGRILREAIREGRYRAVDGVEAWSNRIHVDDLVEGLVAIWRRGENGRIYDLVDDEPHLSDAFARLVAERCGLELRTLTLEETRAAYGPDRLARKLGSKRVSNRRMREELGVELRYPTYREGLPAALDGEGRDAEARGDRADDGA